MRQGILVLVDGDAFARLKAFTSGSDPKLLDHRDMVHLHDKVGN